MVMYVVLLVEDNEEIGANIKDYLELLGWRVDWVKDGQEGLMQAQRVHYDVLVLDVMLPGMDGFVLCQEIRKTSNVPIIMSTAKGEMHDKESGFGGGADDYLVKPFSLKELVLRIQSLLKRTQVSDVVRLGTNEIFVDENKVYRDGAAIKLTLKEWQVLLTLLGEHGRAVSRSMLIDVLWGGDALYEHDGKLDVYISTLRKKLGKEVIETVKGYGYRLVKET